MKNITACLAVALATQVLVGCSRISATTKINPDGSYNRTVKYSVSTMNMTGAQNAGAGPADMFKIPESGNGITVTTPKQDTADKVVVVSRDMAAESGPLNDIVVYQTGKKTAAITGAVEVQKLPDGNLQYTETLHATPSSSAASAGFIKPNADFRATVKSALPERFQKTEIIDHLTLAAGRTVCYLIFGPPEPMITDMFLDPDLLQHKLQSRAKKALANMFREEMPGITDDEMKTLVAKLSANSDLSQKMSSMPESKDSADPSSFTPLTFIASYPGNLVSTNGIVDEDSGEVYWSLLPPSLEFGDVKLTLVVNPRK